MCSIDFKDLKEKIKLVQNDKRYEHTLGVSYTAASLAMCHGENVEHARIAGLLHDCAKSLPNDEKIKLCKDYNMPINSAESSNPFLLHAKAGFLLAKYQYGITDDNILHAILYHTTGRPEMSMLEKIIYIADYIEPNRTHSTSLPRIRNIAFQNLDDALRIILKDTLEYLRKSESIIDPMTQLTYDFYKTI